MKNLIIALIPAKGQSSQIKNKNLLKLGNKTLLEIAIISSLKSKKINQTYVSSESTKILNLAKKYQCKCVRRPKKLSTKNARGIEVIKNFLKNLDTKIKKNNPIIVILQPTSPLRTSTQISNAVKIFEEKKLKFLMSVSKNKITPYKDMIIKNGKLSPIFGKNNLIKNRQSFPQTYKPNGAIFIFKFRKFLNNDSFYNNSHPFIMDDISSIDIDNLNDYKLAKKYFK